MQRRLEYHPACCWPFCPSSQAAAGGGGGPQSPISSSSSSRALLGQRGAAAAAPDHLLIATHTKALMVYVGRRVAWAARLDLQPIAVRVSTIGGVQGMIVVLDDSGRLSVVYLGTDPPQHTVAYADSKEVDYAALEAERRELMGVIKQHQAASVNGEAAAVVAAAKAVEQPEQLLLKAQIPARLDGSSSMGVLGGRAMGGGKGGGADAGERRQMTIRVHVSHNGGPGSAPVCDVAVLAVAPAPVEVQPQQLVLMEVQSSSKSSSSSSAAPWAGAAEEGGPAVAELRLVAAGDSGSSSSGSSFAGAIPASNMLKVRCAGSLEGPC
jgi:Bardet-Biedl syndrome 9 protein